MADGFKELLQRHREVSDEKRNLDYQIGQRVPVEIARSVRERYPRARWVYLEWSDQGDYLELHAYWNEDGHTIHEYGWNSTEADHNVNTWASWINKHPDWTKVLIKDGNAYRIDIEQVLS